MYDSICFFLSEKETYTRIATFRFFDKSTMVQVNYFNNFILSASNTIIHE